MTTILVIAATAIVAMSFVVAAAFIVLGAPAKHSVYAVLVAGILAVGVTAAWCWEDVKQVAADMDGWNAP